MSKVLVDREDIEAVRNTLKNGGAAVGVLRWAESLLAQPAEAEGVEVVAFQVRRTALGTTSNLYTEKLPFVPGEGVTQYSEPTALIRLSDHLAALSSVTAERDRLLGQVAALQSDANSWQSGYDKGREDGAKSAGGWKDQHARDSAELRRLCAERDQLRAEVEGLRKALEQFADDGNWCYDTCNISRGVAKDALVAKDETP